MPRFKGIDFQDKVDGQRLMCHAKVKKIRGHLKKNDYFCRLS